MLNDPLMTAALLIAFVEGSSASVISFGVVCLVVISCFLGAIRFSEREPTEARKSLLRWSVGTGAYLIAIAGVVSTGVLQTNFLPFGPLFMVAMVSIAIAIGFIKTGTKLAKRIPMEVLVGFQAFRLPLEVILHEWSQEGTIPISMTWNGSNWDVITGALAIGMCYWSKNRPWVAWLFNLVGIALLVNVARVALLSAPIPFGWNVKPPLELIAYMPYAYIVPICVGGAALGHVLLTRKLMGISSEVVDHPKTLLEDPLGESSGV